MIKYLYKYTIVWVAMFMLNACGGNINPRPDWVDNPGNGHVGKCGTHIKGALYQEQCAYKKGLTYLAMTKGITADVTANMNVSQTSNATGTSYGVLNADINMQGNEIQIKARITKKWHDRVNDVFYVLIKEE